MIRSAIRSDCLALANIAIQNVASVDTTTLPSEKISSRLEADGFDCSPARFCCEVLTCKADPENILGYCLYYYTYSTWEGRILYIQELFLAKQVLEEERLIHARSMLCHVARIAAKRNCVRIQWFFSVSQAELLAFARTVDMVDITIEENWHQYRWNSAAFNDFLDQQKS